ncbi:MAG: hypothetical protein MUP76_08780 [Acidimicrobiia bacterium]|nr:hypothetical protein [Acidimicrobiia bacterium]
MPVIVVGADTPLGDHVLAALASREGEVRAFVSDEHIAGRLRAAGHRVAVGDVSDASHVSGAAFGCFSAVLLSEAAVDGRERSFAADPGAVFAAWEQALADAGITRSIWVGAAPPGRIAIPETVVVDITDRAPAEISAEVADQDDRPPAGR